MKRECKQKEESFRDLAVGMKFEGSSMLSVFIFFLGWGAVVGCEIDQHNTSNCINELLYDDKITG